MSNKEFRAMVVTETGNKEFTREIKTKTIDDLPKGDVLIEVKYSSLNYKDALSSIGNRGVTRNYPHTPGIDAAGIVVESKDDSIKTGDKVIVTGYDLGMNTSGGFQEFIRVPAGWVVKLPKGLSLKESMMYGTAGFTAALSVSKILESGIKPEDGDILVTGATGGVGTTAVSILGKLGYSVIAATGKLDKRDMLVKLGAKDIIDRKKISDDSGKALLKGQWAGVIDTVGGDILATGIKSVKYGGSVTTCGNVASGELPITVYPFILRGVTLYGIDSVECKLEDKINVWNHLASDWKIDSLDDKIQEVSLNGLEKQIDAMLAGKHTGRTILNLEI